MPPTTQLKVENRLGGRGDSVFTIGDNASIDALLGLCAERFKQPVNGMIGLYTADGKLLSGKSQLKNVVRPNETIYLQQKQPGDDFLFGVNWLHWSALCFVVAILGIVATICVFALTKHKHPFDLGVVIDAGSSHSEAVIFEWRQPKQNGTGQAVEIGSVDGASKGISSLTADQTYVEYTDMLKKVKNITSAKKSDTNPVVYMSATGGMRLLRIQNPDRADAIMTRAREAIKDSGLDYKMAEISDGADEGAQGWVSINHIKNRLSTYQSTLGALDLGGASTQITVEVTEKTNFTRPLKLYGKNYILYSKSYLCFGLDQAYLRYVMTLLINQGVFDKTGDVTITSPCHCNGFGIKKNLSSYLSPCVWNNVAPREVIPGQDRVINMTGAWNAGECRAATTEVLDAAKCSAQGYDYCFDDVETELPMDIQYVAFSGFFFTAAEAKVNTSAGRAQLNEVADTFCNPPYAKWLSDNYKNDTTHSEAGCFKINLVRNMLIDKYKFTDDGYKKIQITKKIDGQGISWPMGLMLNATNALPEEHLTNSEMPLEAFIPLIVFFVLLLLVSFVLFHYHRKADIQKVQGLMFASSIRTS